MKMTSSINPIIFHLQLVFRVTLNMKAMRETVSFHWDTANCFLYQTKLLICCIAGQPTFLLWRPEMSGELNSSSPRHSPKVVGLNPCLSPHPPYAWWHRLPKGFSTQKNDLFRTVIPYYDYDYSDYSDYYYCKYYKYCHYTEWLACFPSVWLNKPCDDWTWALVRLKR